MTVPTSRRTAWRERLWEIIFEADTRAGRAFDITLLWLIIGSIVAVMLESVASIRSEYGTALRVLEWLITIVFSIEYILRLVTSQHPIRYAFSFFGIVDLLSVIPTYVSVLFPGSQSLLVIRTLRLLRVFRVLKLGRYLGQANVLLTALRSSGPKIIVFLGTVMCVVVIVGTAMYLIEGAEAGFTSIPRSVYWAIVTLTTVGYGDIAPRTVLGQGLAAAVMILGYAIIAVPTGIVSAEMVHATRPVTTRVCAACLTEGHATSARFCRDCGESLGRPID